MQTIILFLVLLLCPSLVLATAGQIRSVVMMAKAASSEWTIEDTFTANTASNYIVFSETSGVVVSGGVAVPSNAAENGHTYHITDLGSANMTVQAVVCDEASTNGRSGIVVRTNGTTGHSCAPDQANSRIICFAVGGGTDIYQSYSGTWADGTCHVLYVSTDGSNVYTFKIDFNDDGDFLDTNEDVGTTTNSSFSGTKAGVYFRAGGGAGIYIDNFKAKAN